MCTDSLLKICLAHCIDDRQSQQGCGNKSENIFIWWVGWHSSRTRKITLRPSVESESKNAKIWIFFLKVKDVCDCCGANWFTNFIQECHKNCIVKNCDFIYGTKTLLNSSVENIVSNKLVECTHMTNMSKIRCLQFFRCFAKNWRGY